MGFLDSIFKTPKQDHLDNITSNPVGVGNKATTDLGGMLAQLLGSKQQAGLDSALNVLGQKGKADPRIENASRAEVERDRQVTQQDISQAAGQAGLSGSAGIGALSTQADLGAAAEKNRVARQAAFDRADTERGDLASIFGQLLLSPSLDLIGNRPGAEKNTQSTGLKKLAGVAGQGLGLFSSLSGAFPGGGNQGEQ